MSLNTKRLNAFTRNVANHDSSFMVVYSGLGMYIVLALLMGVLSVSSHRWRTRKNLLPLMMRTGKAIWTQQRLPVCLSLYAQRFVLSSPAHTLTTNKLSLRHVVSFLAVTQCLVPKALQALQYSFETCQTLQAYAGIESEKEMV